MLLGSPPARAGRIVGSTSLVQTSCSVPFDVTSLLAIWLDRGESTIGGRRKIEGGNHPAGERRLGTDSGYGKREVQRGD
jgi:hypothetical protein